MRNTKPLSCSCCGETKFDLVDKCWICETCGAEHATLSTIKESHALVSPFGVKETSPDGTLEDFQVFFHSTKESGLRCGTFHVPTRCFISTCTHNHLGVLHYLRNGWRLNKSKRALVKSGSEEVAGYTLFYVSANLIEKMIAAELLNPDWSLK